MSEKDNDIVGSQVNASLQLILLDYISYLSQNGVSTENIVDILTNGMSKAFAWHLTNILLFTKDGEILAEQNKVDFNKNLPKYIDEMKPLLLQAKETLAKKEEEKKEKQTAVNAIVDSIWSKVTHPGSASIN